MILHKYDPVVPIFNPYTTNLITDCYQEIHPFVYHTLFLQIEIDRITFFLRPQQNYWQKMFGEGNVLMDCLYFCSQTG